MRYDPTVEQFGGAILWSDCVERFSHSRLIEVRRDANKGRGARGVFALQPIPAGTLIECAPVILIPHNHVFGTGEDAKRAARISWYVFSWHVATKREYVALALGYGSIYNHSYTPNARWECVPPDAIQFIARRDIAIGEEVFINYNGDADSTTPVGFDVNH